MNILLHSFYNHFPNHKPKGDSPYVECYNDVFIMREKIKPHSIALLIEPRSIIPEVYDFVEKNSTLFDYVYTHDSRLLDRIDNGRLILWGTVCDYGDNGGMYGDMPKTKNISLVSSNKKMCVLHEARIKLAFDLQDKIDCMGTYNGGKFVGNADIYGEYRFSVAFENYISDYWFTEKICNCFAWNTVPIYYGARQIGEFFNTDGIIQVKSVAEIGRVVDYLLTDDNAEREYNSRLDAIKDNRQRVVAFENFEKRFFDTYEKVGFNKNDNE